MLEWVDKVDGVDDVLAEDINKIANAVIELEEDVSNIEVPDTDLSNYYTKQESDDRYTNINLFDEMIEMLDLGKADKQKRVLITNNSTINIADNTIYYAETDISNLTLVYPKGNFICELDFKIADDGDVTITLPQSKYIGGTPTFANGETWELNIKNKVVVGGLVE